MKITRTLSTGDPVAPEYDLSVEWEDDCEVIFLMITDYGIVGSTEENQAVSTSVCLLDKREALALAQLLNDAANDG